MRLYWRACQFIAFCWTVLVLRPRCHGFHRVPSSGGVVLACNHQSFVDPVLVSMELSREANYMARDSAFANRWLGWLIASLNSFPVRRNTADLTAVKEAIRRLKAGQVLVLFPEGTRTHDGRIGPMLPGLFAVAKKAQVPIVPTLIDGMFQAWPRSRRLPGTGNVIVEYGPPISPADYAALSADELMAEIRSRLIAMQQRWHDRLPERRLAWYQPERAVQVANLFPDRLEPGPTSRC